MIEAWADFRFKAQLILHFPSREQSWQRGFQATESGDPTLRAVHTAWTTYNQDSMRPFFQHGGSLPRDISLRLGRTGYRRA